jgi:hypothetical protein
MQFDQNQVIASRVMRRHGTRISRAAPLMGKTQKEKESKIDPALN